MIITSLLSLTIALQSPAPSPPAVVPQNALQRTAPKLWGLEFSVVINTLDVENNKRPFRMPLIIDGPWSQMADENTLHADTIPAKAKMHTVKITPSQRIIISRVGTMDNQIGNFLRVEH